MADMTNERLAKIRERAEDWRETETGSVNNVVWASRIIYEDVPALLVEVERLRAEQRNWSDGHIIVKLADAESENSRLRAELEAAKGDLHLFAQCVTCEHTYDGGMRCRVPIKAREYKGDYCSTWQWRGVCPEGEKNAEKN